MAASRFGPFRKFGSSLIETSPGEGETAEFDEVQYFQNNATMVSVLTGTGLVGTREGGFHHLWPVQRLDQERLPSSSDRDTDLPELVPSGAIAQGAPPRFLP